MPTGVGGHHHLGCQLLIMIQYRAEWNYTEGCLLLYIVMIWLIEYYRRSPVDDLDHIKLSTGWPGGRLVAEKPDRWPGTHELVPIHLHFDISWAGTCFILWRDILSIIFLLRGSIVWSSHLCRKICSNFKVSSHLHCRVGRCCPYSCCLNLKELLDDIFWTFRPNFSSLN